jgi:ABC-type transport system involved in multi-copper enzyme maturation permease subunit
MLERELPAWWESCRRIRLVGALTLAAAWRMRMADLVVAAGIALVGMVLALREFNFGAPELRFMADFGFGAIGLLGMLLAALVTAQVWFDDLEGGFAACLLAKAVRRWEFVAGRLAGVTLLLALVVALWSSELGLILAFRAAQLGVESVSVAVFIQACGLVGMKVVMVAAFTLLACSYARSAIFATCVGLMLAAISHLREFSTVIGWLGWLRFWPDLGRFEIDSLLHGGRGLTPGQWLAVGGYWAGFLVLFAGVAAYVFRHREL